MRYNIKILINKILYPGLNNFQSLVIDFFCNSEIWAVSGVDNQNIRLSMIILKNNCKEHSLTMGHTNNVT